MTTDKNPTVPSVDMDCLSVQNPTDKERFALYRNELAKAGTIKSILNISLSSKKRNAEDLLNDKIAEVLNDFEDVTGCKVEGMTAKVTKEFSTSNPGEKEYRVKVSLSTDTPKI